MRVNDLDGTVSDWDPRRARDGGRSQDRRVCLASPPAGQLVDEVAPLVPELPHVARDDVVRPKVAVDDH
jgi:hypothetical protein